MKLHAELKHEYVETPPITDAEIQSFAAESGPEVNADDLSREVARTLLRFRAGVVSSQHAKNEAGLLQSLLRITELVDVKRQLDGVEAALKGQRESNGWQ